MQKLVYLSLILLIHLSMTSQNADIKPHSFRFMDEVNTITTESYPWLNSDGLRLYFTQEVDGEDRLVMSSRLSSEERFNSPQLVALPVEEECVSAWLTENELEVYFVARKPDPLTGSKVTLYHAIRKSVFGGFDDVQQIVLNGLTTAYFAGPSLTENRNELYLFSDNEDDRSIVILDRVDVTTYEFRSKVAISEDYVVGPGQLSDDGLKYFLSLSTEEVPEIYYMERPDYHSPFELKGIVSLDKDFTTTVYQPTVNQQGTMIFVSGESSWHDNDLYQLRLDPILKMTFSSKRGIAFNEGDLFTLYPNPPTHNIKISMRNDVVKAVSILDVRGSLVQKKGFDRNTGDIDMDISMLQTGTYIVKVTGAKTGVVFKELMVQ